MADSLSVLKQARELLSDPKHWIKGTFARDDLGMECSPTAESAKCWCLFGAIRKASDDDRVLDPNLSHVGALSIKTLDILASELGNVHPPTWQDTEDRTHSEVLDLLDRVITKLENANGS